MAEGIFDKEKQIYRDILNNISKVIVGKEDVIKKCLVALVSGGHVLLEDVPGTGKTMLAKSLAKSLSTSFQRIQFTPDLLPGDITGLNIWHADSGEFVFAQGPVFTDVLLADEINRATPRTQAGLLECMEERQVTIDGRTRELSDLFFVIATQNPVETSGTFPLPEAQLDRFIMKLSMGFPDSDEEVRILKRFKNEDALDLLDPVADADDITEMRRRLTEVQLSESMFEYIAALSQASRNRTDVTSGISPRGSLALMRCAQTLAMFDGRDYVVPEDIKELAVCVLAHRLIMPHRYGDAMQGEKVIRELLESVSVPTESFTSTAPAE